MNFQSTLVQKYSITKIAHLWICHRWFFCCCWQEVIRKFFKFHQKHALDYMFLRIRLILLGRFISFWLLQPFWMVLFEMWSELYDRFQTTKSTFPFLGIAQFLELQALFAMLLLSVLILQGITTKYAKIWVTFWHVWISRIFVDKLQLAGSRRALSFWARALKTKSKQSQKHGHQTL